MLSGERLAGLTESLSSVHIDRDTDRNGIFKDTRIEHEDLSSAMIDEQIYFAPLKLATSTIKSRLSPPGPSNATTY